MTLKVIKMLTARGSTWSAWNAPLVSESEHSIPTSSPHQHTPRQLDPLGLSGTCLTAVCQAQGPTFIHSGRPTENPTAAPGHFSPPLLCYSAGTKSSLFVN